MIRFILALFVTASLIGSSDMAYSLSAAAEDVLYENRKETETPANTGDVTVEAGRTYSTQWFDFTVESVKMRSEYGGYSAAEGNILVDVVITETSTFDDPIPMGIFDFFVDHITFGDYVYPHDAFDDTMMPEEYYLSKGETVTFRMIFEIPDELSGASLYYVEVDESDAEGLTFSFALN